MGRPRARVARVAVKGFWKATQMLPAGAPISVATSGRIGVATRGGTDCPVAVPVLREPRPGRVKVQHEEICIQVRLVVRAD
jgi:hypothetical protein